MSSFLWIGMALYRWRKGGRITATQVVLMAAATASLAFVFLVQNSLDLDAQIVTWEMTLQNPEPLATYMLLPALVLLLTIVAVVASMFEVRSKKPWSGWEKVRCVAVAAGLVGFLYWAYFWCACCENGPWAPFPFFRTLARLDLLRQISRSFFPNCYP